MNERPYVPAIVCVVPIVGSVAAIWLLTGGDATCGASGCDVWDAAGFSVLLLSFIGGAPVYFISLIRRGWGERMLLGVFATLVLLVVAFPLLASLGHNPQGNYCRYLEPGQEGSWLAIAIEGEVCEIVWRRWLAAGAPWTWVFWVGGITIFAVHRLKRAIENRALEP